MSVFDANVIGNGIKCFCLSCSILHVPIFLHHYLFRNGNNSFFVESFLGPSKIIKLLPINYSGLLPHEGVHANAVTKKLKGISDCRRNLKFGMEKSAKVLFCHDCLVYL